MRIGWEPRGWPQAGYRKYSLALVVIVFATDMVALGVISDEVWFATVSAALTIVTAGNVGEHREERKKAEAHADVAQSQADEAQSHADERAGR